MGAKFKISVRPIVRIAIVLFAVIVGILFLSTLMWTLMKNDMKYKLIGRFIGANSQIKTMSILVQAKDGTILFDESKGGMDKSQPFVIASISKLFTYAVVFNLIDEGILSYDSSLAELLPKEDLSGLHTFNGKEYGPDITIRNLLDQTSGLPDYETERLPDGSILLDEIAKQDKRVDYQQALTLTKSLTPRFAPGTGDSSYYSNMNAEILGHIVETKTGKSLEEMFRKYITGPLELKNTSIPKADSRYQSVYYDDDAVRLPEYITSSVASGGIVSTNEELMKFTRAFFEGKLFNLSNINNPQFRFTQWIPLKYGSGLMQMKMSRLMSPLFPAPEIIGHSGATGSFAFYCPEKEVYITGTINQFKIRPFSIVYLYLSMVQ